MDEMLEDEIERDRLTCQPGLSSQDVPGPSTGPQVQEVTSEELYADILEAVAPQPPATLILPGPVHAPGNSTLPGRPYQPLPRVFIQPAPQQQPAPPRHQTPQQVLPVSQPPPGHAAHSQAGPQRPPPHQQAPQQPPHHQQAPQQPPHHQQAPQQPSSHQIQPAGPALSNGPTFVPPVYLASIRDELPHLQSLPDDFILMTPWDCLLKMESNAMKRQNINKGKSIEDKLLANQESLLLTRLQVNAGICDRSMALHHARFLPGIVGSAQSTWQQARLYLDSHGHAPVANYDMSAIGLGGHVTARGWCELHDPSSTSMTLKLFSRSNVTNKGTGKRITFDGQEDSLEVGDSLSEIASFGDFKQALRTAREALSYVYPWNKSIAALEGFLISTNFCARELGSAAGSGVSTLVKFTNHVFSQNGERWRARTDFLSTSDLAGVWAVWAGPSISNNTAGANKENIKPGGGGPSKKKQKTSGGGDGNNSTARPQSSNQQPASQQPRQPKQPSIMDEVCRRFNLGVCPNGNGPCHTASGNRLKHICNFRTGPGAWCLQNHPRHTNH